MNELLRKVDELRTTQAAEGLPRWRWTTSDLVRLSDLGMFRAEDRIELIGGEIVPMSPVGRRHAVVAETIENAMRALAGSEVRIRSGPQLNLSDDTYVEPDILIYPASMLSYDARGDSVLLVVEVAKSSPDYDRGIKASTYSRYGVRDYWVVDADTLVVRIHHQPGPDGYGEVRDVPPNERCLALLVPQLALSMSVLGLDAT